MRKEKPRGSTGSLIGTVHSGAALGLTTWIAYGVAEYFIITFVEGAYHPRYIFQASHWHINLVLLGIYGGIGIMSGGAIGLLTHLGSRKLSRSRNVDILIFLRSMILLMLGFLFFHNLYHHLPRSALYTLLVPLALAVSILMTLRSSHWASRLAVFTSPWTAGFLMVFPLWLIHSPLVYEGRRVKVLAASAVTVLILIGSYIAVIAYERARRNRGSAASPSLIGAMLRLTPVVLTVLAVSAPVNQQFFRRPLKVNPSASTVRPPNILWIVMDTVRADHLSVYGYTRDTTPNLKSFTEKATLYEMAIAPGDYTLPSHASMFTGLYQTRHGAHFFPDSPLGRPLDEDFITVAEAMSDTGYITICVSANYAYLGSGFGLDQGFQYHEAYTKLGLFDEYYLRRSMVPYVRRIIPSSESTQAFLSAAEINKSVFHYIDELAGHEVPFFLFINYMDAHWPYDPPQPFDTLYPGKGEHNIWDIENAVLKLEREITDDERRHLVSQYDGEIAYLDHQLGELFARLKALGLYDDTLVIVTSDHGEALGERSLLTHAVSVYQDQVHVPLIIKQPNATRKAVVQDFVSLVDLMPTTLDALGFDIPEGMQGQSLLTPTEVATREIMSESFSASFRRNIHFRFRREERAIFKSPLKFISSSLGKRELYDLSRDPYEKNNFYKEGDPAARELQAKLDQWVNSQVTQPSEPTKIDRETVDRLRSLGYAR